MQFLKSLTAWLQIRKTFNSFQLKISLYRRGNLLIFIPNATTKVTYRKLAIQFGQCKSFRQKLAAKVVKTKLKLINHFFPLRLLFCNFSKTLGYVWFLLFIAWPNQVTFEFSCTAAQHHVRANFELGHGEFGSLLNQSVGYFRLLSIALVSFGSRHCSVLFHLLSLALD